MNSRFKEIYFEDLPKLSELLEKRMPSSAMVSLHWSLGWTGSWYWQYVLYIPSTLQNTVDVDSTHGFLGVEFIPRLKLSAEYS
jgi:hypothetical protein